MKVKGLDGKIHNWNPTNTCMSANDMRERSSGHKLAKELLKKLFPFDNPLEEVHIPGCSSILYFDFVLPKQLLAVEVQGEQHRKYVQYFHVTPAGFAEQKKRDGEKRRWCALNGITLVELHDDRSEQWEKQIRESRADS